MFVKYFFCHIDHLLVEEVTGCLIEITSLNKESEKINSYLETEIFFRLVAALEITNNMEVILNCAYIFGNSKTGGNAFSKEEKEKIMDMVLRKLEGLCVKYPLYNNVMELMAWYLRSVLLFNITP